MPARELRMFSAKLNGLLIRACNQVNRQYSLHATSLAPLDSRVAAIEIYMLCPQHGLLFEGSDVDRVINWVSALQTDRQRIKPMKCNHCSGTGIGLESIASVKCNSKFIPR
jgi:hypothetical protein